MSWAKMIITYHHSLIHLIIYSSLPGMQSGDYLWNADNAAVLDMDWLSLCSSAQESAINLLAIDCLSSDDGSSSTIDWSICLPTTMGAGEISINASTDAEVDWERHTNNDCATTEGGSINFCSLKPPAAVTPMEEIPLTLTAPPTQTDVVFKETECDKNANHPYNNKVTYNCKKLSENHFPWWTVCYASWQQARALPFPSSMLWTLTNLKSPLSLPVTT